MVLIVVGEREEVSLGETHGKEESHHGKTHRIPIP
jgi:hypothetical protein